jgi:tRNA dimethylallyltransferase
MNGLGYKEMVPFLHGEISLEEAADRIRLGSRHYAKRQETFLRRLEDIRYVNADDSDAEEQIRKILDGKDRSA